MAQEPIREALADIQSRWEEIAEFKFEESSPHDEDLAREEFELDLHIGQVKVKDLHWLRKQFEGDQLVDLALAIAQTVMPEKTWEIIENNDYPVVTDAERSIVFDMKNGSELSAGASLFLADDQKYHPTQHDTEEANTWMHPRGDRLREILQTAQSHVEQFSKPGEVIQLPTQ